MCALAAIHHSVGTAHQSSLESTSAVPAVLGGPCGLYEPPSKRQVFSGEVDVPYTRWPDPACKEYTVRWLRMKAAEFLTSNNRFRQPLSAHSSLRYMEATAEHREVKNLGVQGSRGWSKAGSVHSRTSQQHILRDGACPRGRHMTEHMILICYRELSAGPSGRSPDPRAS